MDHAFLLIPAQGYVGKFLETFKEFPSRQKAASFTAHLVESVFFVNIRIRTAHSVIKNQPF